MARDWRKRAPPKRSPEQWAREFRAALAGEPNIDALSEGLQQLAEAGDRLRERLPVSMAEIARNGAKAAGLPVADWLCMGMRFPGLLMVNDKAIPRRLKELGSALGLEAAAALKTAKKEPFLLCLGDGVLSSRVQALRRILGLSRPEWMRCIRKWPDILGFKITTFEKQVHEHRRVLELSATDYRKLIQREPRLVKRSPEAIERFLSGLVKLWGLQPAQARQLVLKAPKLLASGPVETMDANLDKLARGFGADKAKLVAAAKLFSPLAYQKPERLIEALTEGAAALGVSRDTLAAAILRSPSLVARRREGWRLRMRFVIRIARALGAEITAKDVLEKLPAALTYGHDRLLQRYAMARLRMGTMNWTALLTLSDARARTRLEERFRQHGDANGLQHALARRGLL